MKKITYYLLIILVFSISLNVNAEDYKLNTLIPVNTKATVETDKFDYKNFMYDTNIDIKGNASIKFDSIQNNTLSKIAVSINVLLFDENQKNIGYLTYCTDKDVSSNYAGFKLRANQASPFTINVTKRYFVEGKTPSDVKFIAVRDENKYCQIGGYSNYNGLTLDEIINGKEETSNLPKLPKLDKNLFKYVLYALIAIAVFGVVLTILKTIRTSNISFKRKPKQNNMEEKEEKIVDLSYSDVGNKPLDLGRFEDEEISSGGLVNDAIEEEIKIEEPPEDNTTSIENLYNSLNEEVVEEEKTNVNPPQEESSVQDLYDSISAIPEQNEEPKSEEKTVSIDELYDSINQDDEDE